MKIVIGNNVNINWYAHIGAINKIVIGDNVLIGSSVLITDHSHGQSGMSNLPPAARPLYSKGPVIIGENVWIGEGAVILGGVEIGSNTIIGANSVVTHDIPANCVAAGVPAKIIKHNNGQV